MLNILHAQLYRLVRSVTFWGFIGLAVFVAFVLGRSACESALAGGSAFGLPVMAYSSDSLLSGRLWVEGELVLDQGRAPFYLALFTSWVVAVLYADDGQRGGMRPLMVGPRSRWQYVLAMALLAIVAALALVAAVCVATAAAIFSFPTLNMGCNGGRLARWVLLVVLVSVFCALATLAVLVVTGRKAVAVLFAVLLCGCAFDSGLFALATLLGAEGALNELIPWLPLQIIGRICGSGTIPDAGDMVAPALFAIAAAALCWLALRRKRI